MLVFQWANAQWNEVTLGSDSMSVSISSNGTFFHQNENPSFEIPKASNKHMFGFGSLWLMGLNNDTVHGAISYNSNKSELRPGPIDTFTGLPSNNTEWNKTWVVTKAEVAYHRTHYQEDGYQVSSAIREWPARHGEPNVNPILAPFIDWNQDGKYDPMDGDYPSVYGEQNAYFIANDAAGEHQYSGSQRLGVEIQGMLYTSSLAGMETTLFARLFIINRSAIAYSPFYVGVFTQMVLGNAVDNFVGTYVTRNLVYGYNGDDLDEGSTGYGNNLPYAGCVFLDKNLFGSIAFNSVDSIRTIPTNAVEFRKVMEGKWRTGADKTMSVNGTESGSITNFIYPGTTDQNNPDLDWNEKNSTDGPGLRNILGIVRFQDLPVNGFVEMNLAYTASNYLTNGSNRFLDQVDDIIKQFGGKSYISKTESNEINVYPNPIMVGQALNISVPSEIVSVAIMSNSGQLIEEFSLNKKKSNFLSVQCSEKIKTGVYILKVITKESTMYKRLQIVNP